MGHIFCFDDFELAVDSQELRREGVLVKTDALSRRLLEVLVRNAGKVITKQDLLAHCWRGRPVTENAVTVAVARLRKVLDHQPGKREVVSTVYGHGYRFLRPVVLARTSSAPRQLTSRSSTSSAEATFVGRERVMAQLNAALRDAHSGIGSVMVLTGEPGVGKTRVAEVLAREAAFSDVQVAWTHCRRLPELPPLWPLIELLRAVIDQLPATVRDARLLEHVSVLAQVFPELGSRGEAGCHEAPQRSLDEVFKHRVFDALARALTIAAEHAPQLLIIDDLDAADAASLEFIHFILDEVPRTRVLLLATLRSDARSDAEPRLRRVLAHRNCARVSVPPLSEMQVASYLGVRFGTLDDAICQAVFAKSEGNPFLMTELARQLQDGEPCNADALRFSGVALDLMRQRIRGLDAAAGETLACAAVIGRSFSLPLLRAVMDRDACGLMLSLDQALASDVIRRTGDSSIHFAFSHEALRAVFYELLEPTQRRSWHWRVAVALERSPGREQRSVSERADHAGLGMPEGDLRKVADDCIRAAHAATDAHAYADAARYLHDAAQAFAMMENEQEPLPSSQTPVRLAIHPAG